MQQRVAVFFAVGLAAGTWGISHAQTPDEPDGCAEGTFWWQRAADLGFCATLCDSDADCDTDERCRVIDDRKPHQPELVEPTDDDVEDALAAEASEIPEVVAEAVNNAECENCDDASPNEEAEPEAAALTEPVRLQLCDPFSDHVGAVPTEVEDSVSDDQLVPDALLAE